jgi:hypothetical protein
MAMSVLSRDPNTKGVANPQKKGKKEKKKTMSRKPTAIAQEAAGGGKIARADPILRLNVGGTPMMTYRSTLASAPPDSVLHRMFADDDDDGDGGDAWRPMMLDDGSYFLDLDPHHFGIVLNALRHGPAILSSLSPESRAGVASVADYLGLVDIADRCNALVSTPIDQMRTLIIVGVRNLYRNGFDLCNMRYCRRIDIGIDWPTGRIRRMATEACSVPEEHAGVYWLRPRKNRTIRPDAVVESDPAVRRNETYSAMMRLTRTDMGMLVLDMRKVARVPKDDGDGREDGPGRALLFVRLYDRIYGTLGACVPALVDTHRRLAALMPDLCALVPSQGAPASGGRVVFYEEAHPDSVDALDVDKTLADQKIEQGDILWIEYGVDENADAFGVLRRDVRQAYVPAHIGGDE